MKKAYISKTVRNLAWRETLGGTGAHPCPVCRYVTIDSMNYHASHIAMEKHGGPAEAWNIIPTCAQCSNQCKDHLWLWAAKNYPDVVIHPRILAAKDRWERAGRDITNFVFNSFPMRDTASPLPGLFHTNIRYVFIWDRQGNMEQADLGTAEGWRWFRATFDLHMIPEHVGVGYLSRVNPAALHN